MHEPKASTLCFHISHVSARAKIISVFAATVETVSLKQKHNIAVVANRQG